MSFEMKEKERCEWVSFIGANVSHENIAQGRDDQSIGGSGQV